MTWKSIFASTSFGVLAVKAGFLFNVLCSHPLPLPFSHGGALLAGQGIAAILGGIGFAWNVLCIIPSETWGSLGMFLVAFVIDLVLGAALIVGVGIQSIYVPHAQGGCSNAERWQVGDNSTNLFTFVGDIRQMSADSTCHEFFNIWVLGIVSGLLSLFGAYASWVRFSRLRSPVRRQTDYHLVIEGGCCVPPPTTHINTLITFAAQYFQKRKTRHSSIATELKSLSVSSDEGAANSDFLTALPLQDGFALTKSLQRVNASRLEQLLSSYPIFVSIIRELHYADLIRLSQTSSNMYQQVFGNSRPVSLSQLKILCCEQDSKTTCWSCRAMICRSCLKFRHTLRPDTSSHLQYCKPYCSSCYYHKLYYCARRRHRIVDKCHSPRHAGYSPAHLCSLCLRDDEELIALARDKRAVREEREILKLARERDTCTNCGVALKAAGPRWWACSTCRSGCMSQYHPAWADEEDDKDGKPSTKE